MKKSIEERFWEKVNKEGPTFEDKGPCWEWTAYLNSGGYGRIKVNGRQEQAHRVSYELIAKPIAEGMELDHLCRNRKCVNPTHLEEVTPKENKRRGISPTAVNSAKSECVNGHGFSENNTYFVYLDDGSVSRKCKICRRNRRIATKELIKTISRLPKPTIEELSLDIQSLSWIQIGLKYGVTDNGARRWAKKYKLI